MLHRELLATTATATLLLLSCGITPQVEAPTEEARAQEMSRAATMESITPLSGRSLEPIGDISEDSRSYLTKRMRNHGNQATDLLNAVILMDMVTTKRIARQIAKPESVSAMNLPREKALHLEFPETFFDMEEAMRKQALRLYAEATLATPDTVLREYSGLLLTCVGCHSLFTRRTHKNIGHLGAPY